MDYRTALIVGAGDGLSASLARLFAQEGLRVGLAARHVDKLRELAAATGAVTMSCDAGEPDQVEALFRSMDEQLGAAPDVVVYNASGRMRGPLVDLPPEAVAQALDGVAFGGFLVAQQAARRMLPLGKGAILFTGASASVKGYKLSAPFAMGKFALRGPRSEHRARAGTSGHPCRPLRDRRWNSQSWARRARRRDRFHARP